MNWVSVASFVWTNVVPVVKDIYDIISMGTYRFIESEVERVEGLPLSGLEKRFEVAKNTKNWLEEKRRRHFDYVFSRNSSTNRNCSC